MNINKTLNSLILALTISLISLLTHAATLTLHESGQFKKTDYLCIPNMACFNLKQAANGRAFPVGDVDFRPIRRMALMNIATQTISSTAVHSSCAEMVATGNKAVFVDVRVGQRGRSSVIESVSCHL